MMQLYFDVPRSDKDKLCDLKLEAKTLMCVLRMWTLGGSGVGECTRVDDL